MATLKSIISTPASASLPDPSAIRIGPITANVSQVILLGCLLSSYGFSQYYWTRLLGGRSSLHIKQFFLALIGHVFLYAIHPNWTCWQNLYGASLTVWWVMRRRRWRSNPAVPVRLFIGLLVHLSLCHLVRQWRDSEDDPTDQTTVLMLLLIKLSSFAFDITDAISYLRSHSTLNLNEQQGGQKGRIQTRSKTAAAAKTANISSDPSHQISEAEDREAKMASLARYPGLLEFIGYIFFFPGVLVGPTISFWEYRQFVEESGPFAQIAAASPGSSVLKGRKRRALRLFLTSMGCLVLYSIFQDRITVKGFFADERVLQMSLPFRLAYLHLAVMVVRLKYYFAWMVSEGAHVLIGIAYRPSPTTGRPLWDRTMNISMRRIECASDFRRVVADWNVCTNRWLYTYVYKRIATNYYGSSRKPAGFRASLVTYVVSAIWHGFYPAYYAVFVTGAFYTFASKRKILSSYAFYYYCSHL